MNKKIYWYCFKRQCREFYELLAVYKLISCSLDEFMSHFTGKKFYDDEIKIGAKLQWHRDEKLLNEIAQYLAEKGFIDKELGASKAMEEHFEYSDKPTVTGKKFHVSLKALFPETTGYRCKTRLYYKERNKKSFKILK
ncbi:MAG: hypothetical protein HOP31_00725 [Ignavibacteria bacterium]|nr:hypothetical protein [Ignavibacteria bacterium]